MSLINIIVGILLWIGTYTITARVCDCFERCSMYKAYNAYKKAKEWQESNTQKDKKVTVKDLYPKENPND